HAAVAPGTGAIPARVGVGNVIADRAEDDLVFYFLNRGDQRIRLLRACAQKMKREALSGFGSDARQLLKLVDEFGDWFCVVEHRFITVVVCVVYSSRPIVSSVMPRSPNLEPSLPFNDSSAFREASLTA